MFPVDTFGKGLLHPEGEKVYQPFTHGMKSRFYAIHGSLTGQTGYEQFPFITVDVCKEPETGTGLWTIQK